MVPRPEQLRERGAGAELAPDSALATDDAFAGVARFLQRSLQDGTGWAWPLAAAGAIRLRQVDDPELGAEGYRLTSGPDGVEIAAARAPPARSTACRRCASCSRRRRSAPRRARSFARLAVPACEILDRPRFRWRGQHVDVVAPLPAAALAEAPRRPARAAQAEHAPPAPDRRPGLAGGDRASTRA